MSETETAFVVAQFLVKEMERFSSNEDKRESLDVALQCIEDTYGISRSETQKFSSVSKIDLDAVVQENRAVDTSKADEAKGDQLKAEGNEAMKSGDYKKAVELYTAAIKVFKSPVYFVNRAAAYTKLNEFEMAIEDCEEGLTVDSEYSKAYSRMGTCYFMQEQYEEAHDAYKKALDLEPNNSAYAQNVQMAKNKLPKEPSTDAPAGMPDLSSLLGGLGGGAGAGQGGMPDINALLQNPALMNMARQFMNNPEMTNLAGQMAGQMGGQMGNEMPGTGDMELESDGTNVMD